MSDTRKYVVEFRQEGHKERRILIEIVVTNGKYYMNLSGKNLGGFTSKEQVKKTLEDVLDEFVSILLE